MPHKKAKKSARELSRKQQGNEQDPGKQSLSDEPIPKSAARILNAAKIQQDYRERKRKAEEGKDDGRKRRKVEDGSKKDGQALSIKPGESIQHFYRRVEDDMRPLVKAAVQTGNATVRSAKKQQGHSKGAQKGGKTNAAEPSDDERPSSSSKKTDSKKEKEKSSAPEKEVKDFAKHSSSAPRRLNDIVQAPPEIKRLPRGAAKLAASGISKKSDSILSMAQKQMMEAEREKAIARYRELKESKRKEAPARTATAS